MLKIKKDNVEMTVPSGLFKNLYESMGYELVSDGKAEKRAAAPEVAAPKEAESTEDKKAFTKSADKKTEKAEK